MNEYIESVIGKKAFKILGFYSGIIGIVEVNHEGMTPYCLVFKDGTKIGFNRLSEITVINK